MNSLWENELKDNPCVDWAEYKKKYTKPYRQLKSEFKLAAPKPGTPVPK